MVGASRCSNHVIAELCKVEYANANNFYSPASTYIPCGWNKSTKKITEPTRISEIVRKKEEKRMQKLNLFEPRTNIYRNVTGEHLSEFFYSLSLSGPSAVLFKSIVGMSIATTLNFTLTDIANKVVVNNKNSSSDQKITLILRKLCFTEKEI